MIFVYNLKIIETDEKIEVWKYDVPIHSNYKMVDMDIDNLERRKFEQLSYQEKAESFLRKQKYYRNKMHDIRRLIEMNYVSDFTKFVTLTFSEQIEDVEKANYMFNKFIKRLKYNLGKSIKYIAVWERTKKNRIHYHVVFFDIKFISWNKLEKIWGNGFIKINDVSHVDKPNVGRYISKYFSKDLDVKDMNKKAFFTSRNLRKPKKITLQTDEELSNLVDLGNQSYSTTYKSKSKFDDKYIDYDVNYYVIDKK